MLITLSATDLGCSPPLQRHTRVKEGATTAREYRGKARPSLQVWQPSRMVSSAGSSQSVTCVLCFGFAAWLSEQQLNPASLSCLHSPEVVKESYNQLRAGPQGSFHLFKSRCNLRFICKRNRVKDILL